MFYLFSNLLTNLLISIFCIGKAFIAGETGVEIESLEEVRNSSHTLATSM